MDIQPEDTTWSMQFHASDTTQVGQFYVKNKVLFFEGDADKSVDIFMGAFDRSLSQQIDDYEKVLRNYAAETDYDNAASRVLDKWTKNEVSN